MTFNLWCCIWAQSYLEARCLRTLAICFMSGKLSSLLPTYPGVQRWTFPRVRTQKALMNERTQVIIKSFSGCSELLPQGESGPFHVWLGSFQTTDLWGLRNHIALLLWACSENPTWASPSVVPYAITHHVDSPDMHRNQPCIAFVYAAFKTYSLRKCIITLLVLDVTEKKAEFPELQLWGETSSVVCRLKMS